MKNWRDWILCVAGSLAAGYGAGLAGVVLFGAFAYGLSSLLFPAALSSAAYVRALDGTAVCGFLLGFGSGMAAWISVVPVCAAFGEQVLPYIRFLVAAFAIWIGLTFTVVVFIYITVFVLALTGLDAKIFSSSPQPRAGYLLCCYLPTFLWGASLLRWGWQNVEHRSFAAWRQDIGEILQINMRPRPGDALERFVLRVPQPLESFLDRLPQEVAVETNPFVALGQMLPILVPGRKEVSVKLTPCKGDANHVAARFKRRGAGPHYFQATLTGHGEATLLEADSQMPAVLMAYQMLWLLWFGLVALFLVLFAVCGLVMVILRAAGIETGKAADSNPHFYLGIFSFALGAVALWLVVVASHRLLSWKARKQELFLVDLFQTRLGAELIERGPRPRRFWFF